MRADIRLWTAIAMIGICGFSVAQGWRIVHFSIAMANNDSSEKRAEVISTWTAVPGRLDGFASGLTDEITLWPEGGQSPARGILRNCFDQAVVFDRLVSLSSTQLATDQPMEQILKSLAPSTLTGPNEGYVMGSVRFSPFHYGKFCRQISRAVAIDLAPVIFPLFRERQKEGSFRSFATNPSKCGTSCDKRRRTGVRRKRSNNDWDFSFRVKVPRRAHPFCIFDDPLWGRCKRGTPGKNETSGWWY
jgi:hypothetical protein